jgi:hypothetical protein
MIELAAATSALQEIKRLQRDGEWQDLLERYSTLRSALIAIRASSQVLIEQHQTVIQGAITQIRTIETKVERAIEAGDKPSAARLNAVVSDQLDKLSQVLGELRSKQNA